MRSKRKPVLETEPASKTAVMPVMHEKVASSRRVSWGRKVLKVLGPGLVTGAADDDPSGIAIYASVGVQFGYSMLWTMLFIYPFMAESRR